MKNLPKDIGDRQTLARFLTGRYGVFALARAAGEVASANTLGDHERSALWRCVIEDLRQTVRVIETGADPA